MNRVKLSSNTLATSIAIIIVGYILFANTIPFNVRQEYSVTKNGTPTITPNNRVEKTETTTQQTDDLVYFNSKMAFKFDHTKTKIAFKNPSPDQQILLGYKDQQVWHYNSQVLDNPVMDSLIWPKIGNGPYLYQKNPTYKTVDDFIKNPPQNKTVGVYDYSDIEALQPNITLADYQAAKIKTNINVPLRGKTVMYAYLSKEIFEMTLTKRDLNWVDDPDVTKISVFKGKDEVYSATIDDDGNSTSNHQAGQTQTIDIKNPGPGLPESGVYKIVIDATGDSIISNIATNLHKIAFEGPLYVADNHEVYGDIVPKTIPTSLITNAQQISFRSDHGQSKTALVDKQVTKITKPNQVYTATNPSPSANITIPGSDMIVNGSGYFSFSKDQFFTPSPYKILPINSVADIEQANYILTNYKVPKREGDWLVAEREFNLNNAVVQKGQLSWLLSAPGLKENNHTVEYKQIDMTLSKKGWLEQ
jgi:hypothetical protein